MIKYLKNWLLKRNFYLTTTTREGKLYLFFSSIRPVTTDKHLIRIGGDTDAGYLIPDDLNGVKICFSPGVSTSSTFENELAKSEIRSFLADYSVEQPPVTNDHFSFLKKFIGFENSDIFITLENWVNQCADKDDREMILQMDIEGSEYPVLIDSSSDLLKRFRILIIEFHQFDSILNAQAFDKVASCFYKLLKDFYIVHIHPNNCGRVVRFKDFEVPTVLEFTFIRKDRVQSVEYTKSFPHPLDRPNLIQKSDILLPHCFYQLNPKK